MIKIRKDTDCIHTERKENKEIGKKDKKWKNLTFGKI